MAPSRLLLALVQPLLAFLLLAGLPGMAERMQGEAGALVRVVDGAGNSIRLHRASSPAGDIGAREDEPREPPGSSPEPRLLAMAAWTNDPISWRAAPALRPARAAAPSTHRACAAPPTGPPPSLA